MEVRKIYIAAPYTQRLLMAHQAAILRANGIAITSRWIFEQDEPNDESARKDLQDIEDADILVLFNLWTSVTGGMHVEFGYALKAGKPIIVIGEKGNVFHHLSHLHVVPSVAEAIYLIRTIALGTDSVVHHTSENPSQTLMTDPQKP